MPKVFLDSNEIQRTIARIAHEILERNTNPNGLALVGIRTRGVIIAERIRSKIQEICSVNVPFGILDITLYRDDLSEVGVHPQIKETNIPFELERYTLVLVDDVLFTGRTIRAALNAISDFGRPRAVQLAVLVDRGLLHMQTLQDPCWLVPTPYVQAPAVLHRCRRQQYLRPCHPAPVRGGRHN